MKPKQLLYFQLSVILVVLAHSGLFASDESSGTIFLRFITSEKLRLNNNFLCHQGSQ